MSTTSVLQIGGAITDAIDMPGDMDVHILDVESGNAYTISMRGTTDAPLEDSYLSLFDENGNIIAFDDDSGGGLDAQLLFVPEASGRIYVAAEAFSSTSDFGVYSIEVIETFLASARVVGQSANVEADFLL